MALPPPSEGSTCLVTGASSGIGMELARGLARRGHDVTLTARRGELLETLAAELRAQHGVGVAVHPCDLGDADQREELLAAVAQRGKDVEVLVNNAGFGTLGRFHELAGLRERSVVRVCVEAPVHLCEAYTPDMVRRGRGAVLNVASIVAFQPMPGMATYGAAKSFVLSFSSALHAELEPYGVTVSVLAPGPVRSGFAEAAGGADEASRIPDFAWRTSAGAAEDALLGLERGRRLVVPKRLIRIAAAASHLAPRGAALPIVRRVILSGQATA